MAVLLVWFGFIYMTAGSTADLAGGGCPCIASAVMLIICSMCLAFLADNFGLVHTVAAAGVTITRAKA